MTRPNSPSRRSRRWRRRTRAAHLHRPQGVARRRADDQVRWRQRSDRLRRAWPVRQVQACRLRVHRRRSQDVQDRREPEEDLALTFHGPAVPWRRRRSAEPAKSRVWRDDRYRERADPCPETEFARPLHLRRRRLVGLAHRRPRGGGRRQRRHLDQGPIRRRPMVRIPDLSASRSAASTPWWRSATPWSTAFCASSISPMATS